MWSENQLSNFERRVQNYVYEKNKVWQNQVVEEVGKLEKNTGSLKHALKRDRFKDIAEHGNYTRMTSVTTYQLSITITYLDQWYRQYLIIMIPELEIFRLVDSTSSLHFFYG